MSPAYRMTTFGLRLAAPIDHNQSRHSVFITGGAAAASGLSYRVSPFAGVGWQSAWAANRLATRIELQVFSRGTGPQDKARVLVGFVVALR
jgi:hypothetical protein